MYDLSEPFSIPIRIRYRITYIKYPIDRDLKYGKPAGA